jgi:DNA-directed RNA polymerase subunit K/omega
LQSGARPLIETSSRKPCRIAAQEIQAQKVKWTIPEPKDDAGNNQAMVDPQED